MSEPRSGTLERQRAERRGRRAEKIAAWFLRAKGYAVLARRYKTPVGEIDLVARRGRTLAFVEVKARKEGEAALEAVGPRSRARIARAAEAWITRYPDAARLDLRFDIVVVSPGFGWPRHITNAFGAGGAV